MRVLLMTCEDPIQRALASKISQVGEVSTVVFSKNIPRKKASRSLGGTVNSLAGRTIGSPFIRTWFDLQDRYASAYTSFPTAEQLRVANVNDAEVVEAIERDKPDVVAVSGTNLVGRRVIEAAQKYGSIVNLHTGISPYVKGGPNCTNWCLAKGWFHLIGSTIMWLDPGIDTGDIIATERTELTGEESLGELHWKVMEHAQDLYVRAINLFARGETPPRVPQSEVGSGTTFMNRDWNARAMWQARRNLARAFPQVLRERKEVEAAAAKLRLVRI